MTASRSLRDLLAEAADAPAVHRMSVDETAEYLRAAPDPDDPHTCVPYEVRPCAACILQDEMGVEAMEAEPRCCHEPPDSPSACYEASHGDQ